MPLQNRVTPFGELVATPARGLMMGNRGVLHDASRQIVRPYQLQRWIACLTEFRGRRRQIMRPGSYTELFFLDEATALAAGHRPCAECRRADYLRFKSAWGAWSGEAPEQLRADQMDAVLHTDRLAQDGRLKPRMQQRTYLEEIRRLPDGAMIAADGAAWLIWDDALYQWTPNGYATRRPRPQEAQVTVLTPHALVGVLQAGYRVMVHPSVVSGSGGSGYR